MSLCLVVQTSNEIFMASDTRESIAIGDEFYSTGRQVKKIHVVGNQVIALSGVYDITKATIEEYERSGIWTLNNLREIMKKHVSAFIELHGSNSGVSSEYIGAIICCYEEGLTKFYSIRSAENYQITENIRRPIRASAGVHMEEALSILKELPPGSDVIDGFHKVYTDLADECVGGHMTFFLIDKTGIRWVKRPIQDHRVIKLVPNITGLLREKGLVIERDDNASRVTMNSDEMKWEINGESRLYYDAWENVLKFGGRLEAADGIFSGDLSAVGGTFTGTLEGVDGIFTGDLSAVGGTFTGTLEGVDGTFTGTISGGSIISNTDINITNDARIGNNLYLGLAGAVNDRRIEFVDPSIYEAYISFTHETKELKLRGANDVRLSSGLNVTLNAAYDVILSPGFSAYVGDPIPGNRIVTASELDAIWEALSSKANINHTHSLTIPNHNHGNPDNLNGGGGTFNIS